MVVIVKMTAKFEYRATAIFVSCGKKISVEIFHASYSWMLITE